MDAGNLVALPKSRLFGTIAINYRHCVSGMETLSQCFVKLVQTFDGLFIVNSAEHFFDIPPCLSMRPRCHGAADKMGLMPFSCNMFFHSSAMNHCTRHREQHVKQNAKTLENLFGENPQRIQNFLSIRHDSLERLNEDRAALKSGILARQKLLHVAQLANDTNRRYQSQTNDCCSPWVGVNVKDSWDSMCCLKGQCLRQGFSWPLWTGEME